MYDISILKSEFHLGWCFGCTHIIYIYTYSHMHEPGKGVARCDQGQPNKQFFKIYLKGWERRKEGREKGEEKERKEGELRKEKEKGMGKRKRMKKEREERMNEEFQCMFIKSKLSLLGTE